MGIVMMVTGEHHVRKNVLIRIVKIAINRQVIAFCVRMAFGGRDARVNAQRTVISHIDVMKVNVIGVKMVTGEHYVKTNVQRTVVLVMM